MDLLRDAALVLHGLPRRALPPEAEQDQQFDLLVLDAFSSSAVPVHLLTKEAFEIYQRHLLPDGVIAAHISNDELDLRGVVARLAAHAGMEGVVIETDEERERGILRSAWALLTRNPAFLRERTIDSRGVRTAGQFEHGSLWTDDHVNLFETLR